MVSGDYLAARVLLEEADAVRRNRPETLHDLGVCSVMVARERFQQENHAAALREADLAIEYYSRAIEERPGYQAAVIGRGIAHKLKGQFEEAMDTARWAAEFVGPAARQYTYLAEELERRGDVDGALMRYRQAVAVEPTSFDAHADFARFLLRYGKERAAVFHLKKAYRLNPSDRWVIRELSKRGELEPMPPPS